MPKHARTKGHSRELARLATIPRGSRGEEFRVSVDEYAPADAAPSQYVSARIWYPIEGEMRPGKGTTIRRGELRQVIEALLHAERVLTSGADDAASTQPGELDHAPIE